MRIRSSAFLMRYVWCGIWFFDGLYDLKHTTYLPVVILFSRFKIREKVGRRKYFSVTLILKTFLTPIKLSKGILNISFKLLSADYVAMMRQKEFHVFNTI